MSVYPYLTLAPGLEVEEGVAHFLQVEVAAVVASAEYQVFALSGKAIAAAHYRSVQLLLRGGLLFLLFKGVDGGFVVVGDGPAIPTVGGEGNLRFVNAAKMRMHGCIDDGLSDESLVVLDCAAEVDASHALDQNLQLLSGFDVGQLHCGFVLAAVCLADVLAVNEDLCIVVGIEGEPGLA